MLRGEGDFFFLRKKIDCMYDVPLDRLASDESRAVTSWGKNSRGTA